MYIVNYRLGNVKYEKVFTSYKECMVHKEYIETKYGTNYNYYIRSIELVGLVK